MANKTQYTTNRSTNHNVRQGVFRTNDSAAEPGRVGQELKRLGVAFPGDGHRQAIRVAQQGTKVGAEQCGQHVCGRGVGRKYNIKRKYKENKSLVASTTLQVIGARLFFYIMGSVLHVDPTSSIHINQLKST